MISTPKWYSKSKTMPIHIFIKMNKLANELRRLIKKISIHVKVDIFSEHTTILEECEKIIELYWSLKDESKNNELMTLSKKIKRSPYNVLLFRKFNILMELNDRRFLQLTFVLKKTLSYLLRKSMQSEIWLTWALEIANLYNKCGISIQTSDTKSLSRETDANICSNTYPSLLLPLKYIDFGYVLQLVSQTRIEQSSLDLIFGLLNLGDQDSWRESDSSCSSLEILRILTLNVAGENDFQQYLDPNMHFNETKIETDKEENKFQSLGSKHIEFFLYKEKIFLTELIIKSHDICPSIFGTSKSFNFQSFLVRSMKDLWTYVGITLDHIILWWIDTPVSCYPISHVESIRNWLYTQNSNEIPEPIYSTLKGVGEILTNFVSNNLWDQLFRLTLVSSSNQNNTFQVFESRESAERENFSPTRTSTMWNTVFTQLRILSNNICSKDVQNSPLLPVAEQIPILHRIDHSVHSMRLWVKEQAKLLCAEWKMDKFFAILENDVKTCLETCLLIQLPKLTSDLTDVLMLVCVALRAKLIYEINVNIDKLKITSDECVQIMSSVCLTLSMANFSLCFPKADYWQQKHVVTAEKSEYVTFVLDQIYLPCIKATNDIVNLKLILKIICQAWLDYIYQHRIKFSVSGASSLLNDFEKVREWIMNCSDLSQEFANKLSDHEVLRMCKGVGKILLRKPEDIISITQSPKLKKSSDKDDAIQETQLPAEMFVSNQKHWLQLRAGSGKCSLYFCCRE